MIPDGRNVTTSTGMFSFPLSLFGYFPFFVLSSLWLWVQPCSCAGLLHHAPLDELTRELQISACFSSWIMPASI